VEGYFRQGVDDLDAGRLGRARISFAKVLELDPRHAKALCNLGTILQWEGKDEEAEACYRGALTTAPALAQAWFNLGQLARKRRRGADAVAAYRRAVELDPAQAEWHAALGWALAQVGRPLQARQSVEAALQLDPERAELREQLGTCLLEAGDADGAVAAYERALELNPQLGSAHSRMLLAMNLAPSQTPDDVLRAHFGWAGEFAAGRKREFGNDALAARKLRIGYYAPDFGDPSLACLIQPVLAAHDRAQFEVVCYSDAEAEGPACWPVRASAELWHAIANLDDQRLATRMLEDGIDVLVDLGGHAAGGKRMGMFAVKAAPVQVSWPTYPSSTGLDTYVGRIADWNACPEGDARLYTERLIRLSASQWCFAPQADVPLAAARPSGANAAVTFGAFHAASHISAPAIAAWVKVLLAVPSSRLVIGGRCMDDIAAQLVQRFADAGVQADRIECRDWLPLDAHLSALGRVDVVLDAMPVSSVAGTLYALWMGVPVVTLAGSSAASRGAAGVLNVLGLGEWIAHGEDGFAASAAALAADPVRRASLRQELRPRLAGSALMDAARYTRELEKAYRDAWRAWCVGKRRRAPEAATRTRAAAPRPCKLAVDGVFFQSHNTGIARLWRTILQEWVKSGFAANVVLLDREGTAPDIAGVTRLAVPKHDYARLDDDRAMLQRACDETGAQAFISTYYSAPLTTPTVMMVYDMIPEVIGYDLELPEWREKRACIEAARRYVAISRNTLRDLYRLYPGIARERVDVAYPAAESVFRPAGADELDRFRARHGITRPYFLLVGARDSQYKNAGAFFRAFAELPERSQCGVLCVGGELEVTASARQACSGSELHHLRLDDAELRLAYAGAIALAYPSIYEGFGMPVVEAMSCGCPVITTSHGSLPEAGGDAAIYVSPHDPGGLALALAQVRRPAVRGPMIDRGLKRARSFSWTRMADAVAAVLEQVAGEKLPGARAQGPRP
jgi:predicted O-linked N-acetylglucosamine transferase (SPINDLY family)/glycosyltransferase involved in cell wall biosynthesis